MTYQNVRTRKCKGRSIDLDTRNEGSSSKSFGEILKCVDVLIIYTLSILVQG